MRMAVRRQLGTDRPQAADIDPSAVMRFADDLPETLDPQTRERLLAQAEELAPWLQGPFLLGGDLVIGGAWRIDFRWLGLGPEVGSDLSGMRVLDVGTNAGYDAFMFHRLGADYVLACEPWLGFIEQARFLESLFRTGVDFRPIGWQALDPAEHGQFDVIHCGGILYHEANPMALLQTLRPLLRDSGTFFLGSMMLAEPELGELIRFVPDSFYNDPTWWMVPGRLALRWMLETSGFAVTKEFGVTEGPPGHFRVIYGYMRCAARAPAAHLTTWRPG
jgi:SAM-dependent methyltransferase